MVYCYTTSKLFRSFFSNISNSENARSGIFPSVSKEEINNLANWSFTPPSQNDFDVFQRTSYLAQGEYSGLIGRDIDGVAMKRATLGFGANPYAKIVKPLLENLSARELQNQNKNNPWYDYFVSEYPNLQKIQKPGKIIL